MDTTAYVKPAEVPEDRLPLVGFTLVGSSRLFCRKVSK